MSAELPQNFQPRPSSGRRLASFAMAALALGIVPLEGSGSTRRYNVTECCRCRATIGPGRDGRMCNACRKKVGE